MYNESKDRGTASERDRGQRQLPSTLIAKKGGFEQRLMFWCRTPTWDLPRAHEFHELRGADALSGGRTRPFGGRLMGLTEALRRKRWPDPNLCAGSLARFEELSLTLRHPALFDVKALHI